MKGVSGAPAPKGLFSAQGTNSSNYAQMLIQA